MEPKALDLGAGIQLTPMTLIIVSLVFVTLYKKYFAKKDEDKSSIHMGKADLFIFLFYISSVISYISMPHINVLYGLMKIGEAIILYYLLRKYLNREMIPGVAKIIIFSFIYQMVLGLLQGALQRNIGLTTELVTQTSPYGFTASENDALYRVTGVFGHPNFLASFLLIFLPFIFYYLKDSLWSSIIKILAVVAMIFTYSRLAWFLTLIFLIMYFYQKKDIYLKLLRKNVKSLGLGLLGCIMLLIILFPYLNARISTVSEAFEDPGSMTTRFKLAEEALNLIVQFPLTGVGLNRSLEYYSQYPVTDFFQGFIPTSFFKIHSLFLEIAAEAGLPALLFFLIFIYLVIVKYIRDTKSNQSKEMSIFRKSAFYGFVLFLIFSNFHPFLFSNQMRYFFLLSAIILA